MPPTPVESSQTYLLTLASRSPSIRSLVVLVEESDGKFSHHRAKFNDDGSWINVVGNMQALAHDILTNMVSFVSCNPDGSDIEADDDCDA